MPFDTDSGSDVVDRRHGQTHQETTKAETELV